MPAQRMAEGQSLWDCYDLIELLSLLTWNVWNRKIPNPKLSQSQSRAHRGVHVAKAAYLFCFIWCHVVLSVMFPD